MTDKITYMGRRIEGGKLQHLFLGEDETSHFYPKAKSGVFRGCEIGATYEIGEHFPGIWQQCMVNQERHVKALDWEVADRAASAKYREMKKSPTPELDNIVSQLRTARDAMPARLRGSFDAWLLNQIR